jgi:predicted membrane protein
MRALKVLSIIGIIYFALCLLCILLLASGSDYFASSGWGLLAVFYAIPFSIVTLVVSAKSKTEDTGSSISDRLVEIHDLKEKGILTEQEYLTQKAIILSSKK